MHDLAQLRVFDARRRAPERHDSIDIRIEQAFAQDALPDHAGRAEQQHFHRSLLAAAGTADGATCAHVQMPFQRIDGERRPDRAVADQPVVAERLLYSEHADQQLQRRRDVLDQPEHRKRDAARAGREEQERNRGDRARRDEQQLHAE